MSYATRLDEMIAGHMAQLQTAMKLARMMEDQPKAAPMPDDYPMSVYHPHHRLATPAVHAFIAHSGGKLSNGVPKILGMELLHGYVLGAYYNPANDSPAARGAA